MELDHISELLTKINNLHFASGPVHQDAERLKALNCLESNEIRGIYHLTESHSPSLRYKAMYRHERNMQDELESINKYTTINKDTLNFNCKDSNIHENINNMLKQVQEMPKEWVIIQLTPHYNPHWRLNTVQEKHYANSMHITLFHCGKNQPKPFSIKINAPIDQINGNVIDIHEEMRLIIAENKKSFTHLKMNEKKPVYFNSHMDKHMYSKARYNINNRLKNLVKDIQDIFLSEWRCLFIGKLMNDGESIVSRKLDALLTNSKVEVVSEKIRSILKCLIKSSDCLKLKEIKKMVQYCFPNNKELHPNLVKSVYEMQEMKFSSQERHPVILTIDEKIDSIPWEMLDVLKDHPVSRMPSLHFTYALYKEHENTIVDGVKVGVDYKNGRYIINPGLDLKQMETRLKNFFKYWTPYWRGLVGVTPSCEEFEEMLLNSDIFSYNGHGNGSQFFSSDKIQKLRINSVVLLFGCGSVSYSSLGPQVEMYGSHQMYLIACSPCVVGMLWEVTDYDTDSLSTEFWSLWLPKHAQSHWKTIDKKMWESTGQIEPISTKSDSCIINRNEPELLRALCKAKKAAHQYLNQASCVARGIPVKIKN